MQDLILMRVDRANKDLLDMSYKELMTIAHMLETYDGMHLGFSFREELITGTYNNSPEEFRLIMSSQDIQDSANVIRLFGFFYGMDTGWFYLNNPMKAPGIPAVSIQNLLGAAGVAVPKNIDDIIARYKLTGKLDRFAEELISPGAGIEMQESFLRFLLLAEGVREVEPYQVINRIFRTMDNFSHIVQRVRMLSDSMQEVALDNIVSTFPRNLSAYWDSLTRASRYNADPERAMLYAYALSAPENPTGGVFTVTKSSFAKLKAVNSFDILAAEGRESDAYPFFDIVETDRSSSRYLQLVDGRERSAAQKSMDKNYDDSIRPTGVGSIDPGRPAFTYKGQWNVLEKVFAVARQVSRKVANI